MGFTAIILIHVRWTQNLDYVQTYITSLILKEKFNEAFRLSTYEVKEMRPFN